jgi:hypothetical protein
MGRLMNSADSEPVVEETPDLKASVELEIQAKIDSDVRDAVARVNLEERDHPYGMTLAAQERWEARETSARSRDSYRVDFGVTAVRGEHSGAYHRALGACK